MCASGASLAVLKALTQAFNDHDLDGIVSFFAEDAVLEMPRGPEPRVIMIFSTHSGFAIVIWLSSVLSTEWLGQARTNTWQSA